MKATARRASFATALAMTAASVAVAQTLSADTAPSVAIGPPPSAYAFASDNGAAGLGTIEALLAATRSGSAARLRAAMASQPDPVARKLGLWLLIESAPDSMTFAEAQEARDSLRGWPHAPKRDIVAERLLDQSGLSAPAVIAWFAGAAPRTAQGAMSLAAALRATGAAPAAAEVIRTAWREMIFDVEAQEAMLARFGDVLTPEDHAVRADMLLYGAEGVAAEDMLRLVSPQQRAVGLARMALRRGDSSAQTLIDALPLADRADPGLLYERLVQLEEAGDTAGALSLVRYMPATLPNTAAAERLWRHGALVVAALRTGDAAGALAAATRAQAVSGQDAAEAAFYAGWIALSRLKDARLADQHFARLQALAASPITQARALYWRGRAAEAADDPVSAQVFYGQAARFQTTFYGQLAATRGGPATLTLGRDPDVTAADRARFESDDAVRAIRLLSRAGAKDLFRVFVAGLSETLPSAVDEAQLVDLARASGDQEISMRVVRNAAHRGMILPERGYPVRTPPVVAQAPETPLILGIVRQESSFDPSARSGVGARGMMQLMPATAQNLSRRMGLGWGSLDDPDFNMRVGSAFLGQLVGQFSGSYVMATAAYNAGPARPTQWSVQCGDPRGSATDPLDFIECIPFSETRDYVMRVLEATQVYRARLNGGVAPITLAADLKRGAFGYAFGPVVASAKPAIITGYDR